MPCFRPRRADRGTSLIEVIVALGLLASLLISAAALLVEGNRQIDGAGHRSQALAVAETVLAELAVGGFARLPERLGCAAQLSVCSMDAGAPPAAGWRALAEESLPRPKLEVRLEAVGASTLAAAPALRISVRVSWVERGRPRRVQLRTMRV